MPCSTSDFFAPDARRVTRLFSWDTAAGAQEQFPAAFDDKFRVLVNCSLLLSRTNTTAVATSTFTLVREGATVPHTIYARSFEVGDGTLIPADLQGVEVQGTNLQFFTPSGIIMSDPIVMPPRSILVVTNTIGNAISTLWSGIMIEANRQEDLLPVLGRP